jgi:hypothetical protein
VAAYRQTGATGLGFALGSAADVHFAGVDFDKCRNPQTREIDEWARKLITYFDSYTEISPSGTGVKIFLLATLPPQTEQGKRYKVEIYDRKRYFAVTGRHLDGTRTTVEFREHQLRTLHERIWTGHLLELVLSFGLVLREDAARGHVYIKCPWIDGHSTPDGERDAMLYVADGKPIGFKCFHGSCSHRQLSDVFALFGIDSKAPATERRLSLTFANTITPKRAKFLWDERLPLGELSLLAGREGIGKTTFAYTLIADITKGKLKGDTFGVPRTVIIAASEDSWEHTIVPRLMAADADLSRVARVDVELVGNIQMELSLPRDIAALESIITQHQVALVLVDPLISRLDKKIDTHKDSDVRQALEPLVRLAHSTNAVVWGVIHVNKGASRDPLNMVMGSRAFVAVPRAVIFVVEDPKDDQIRLVGQPKNNLGRTDLPTLSFRIDSHLVAHSDDDGPIYAGKLCWTGESYRTIREVVEEAARPNAQSATAYATVWLQEYLQKKGAPVESKEIIEAGKASGLSRSALQRARQVLQVNVDNTATVPKRTLWSLPDLRY